MWAVGCRGSGHQEQAVDFGEIRATFVRGDLDAAARQAEEEKSRLLVSDPARSFQFRLLEAEVLQYQGKSRDLVGLLKAEVPSFVPTGDSEIKKLTLLSLADVRLGNGKQSSDELHEALRLSAATHSRLQGEILRTQGLLEGRNRHPVEAQSFFRESLEVARLQGDDYLAATDLLNLGTIALQAEHIDEALDRFRDASQLAAKIHADLILQNILGNEGWAYYDLGDFERAMEAFRKAESEAATLGANDSQILWLESAGQASSQLGDLQTAESYYQQAMNAAVLNHNLSRQAESETALGMLAFRRKDMSGARAHADAALTETMQLQDKAAELDAQLVQALIASATRTPEAESLLRHVLDEGRELPSIRWSAADALASLYVAKKQPRQAEQFYHEAISTFEAQRSSVEDGELRLPFSANGDELYRHYADFLIDNHRSLDALRLLDGARAMSLQETAGKPGQAKSAAGEADPIRALPGTDVVLFYSLGAERSYLWAIERRGVHLYPLSSSVEIGTRIRAYQGRILKSRDALQEEDADARWLYEALVAPVENLIPKNARVLLIPDGPMHGFNMETLLRSGSQGLHYWMEDVSLTTASSLRLLSRSGSHGKPLLSTSSGKLLLIGDPVLSNQDYEPLTHAAAEVEDVERYFPLERRTTLTRAVASPDAYAASHPAQYTYLHFVAHGTASRQRPLDSAIILSSSPRDPDRYKLYARDIVQEPLHARLVTISACYGSGVRNYVGEGMVGLSWAFLRAGAHQVIAALWEVSDTSTAGMMDRMYQELTTGAKPDEALRTAKISLLHSHGVFRKPVYWAPFQLYTGS